MTGEGDREGRRERGREGGREGRRERERGRKGGREGVRVINITVDKLNQGSYNRTIANKTTGIYYNV